jgi:TIR domain-containing protein/HEAT repeat protein
MLDKTEKAYFDSLCWEKINPIREIHQSVIQKINPITNPGNSPAPYTHEIRRFKKEIAEARIKAYIETYQKVGRYPDESEFEEFGKELLGIVDNKGNNLPKQLKGALSPYPPQLVERIEEQLSDEIRQDAGIALSALHHFINEGKLVALQKASQTKEMDYDKHYLRLKKVYQATGGSQRKAVNLAEVLKDEGLSQAEIDNEAEYMEGEGWIKAFGDEGIDFFITHMGIKAYQASLNKGPNESREIVQINNQTSSLDIFISHSSKDKDVAEALINLLRDALSLPASSIRCTSVDGYRLPAGASTDEQLRQEIYTAKVFLGLITPTSFQSTYVLFELGARWGARLPLAPVLASGANADTLRAPLSGLNALSCDVPAQVHQLVDNIAAILKVNLGSVASYQKYVDALIQQSKAEKEQAHSENRGGAAEEVGTSIFTSVDEKTEQTQITRLRQELLSSYPGDREKAARELGRLGSTASSAVPTLIKKLKDSSGPTRDAAAWALREIGTKQALDALARYENK